MEENLSNESLFIKSCGNGDISRLRNLFEKKFSSISQTALKKGLRIACRKGRIEVVKALITEWNVDPSVDNNNAIREACMSEEEDIVELLLSDERVDPSDFGNEAIRFATFFSHVGIIGRLLEDPRVDPSDKTFKNVVLGTKSALDIAKEKENDQILKLFKEHNKNWEILMKSKSNYSPEDKYNSEDDSFDDFSPLSKSYGGDSTSNNGNHLRNSFLLLEDMNESHSMERNETESEKEIAELMFEFDNTQPLDLALSPTTEQSFIEKRLNFSNLSQEEGDDESEEERYTSLVYYGDEKLKGNSKKKAIIGGIFVFLVVCGLGATIWWKKKNQKKIK